jgi:gluconolactonase
MGRDYREQARSHILLTHERRIEMKNSPLVISALLASLLSACATHSTTPQAAAPAAPAKSTQPLGFFVTSTGIGKGADLGGLAGADAHCQKLATAVGAGNKTWHAYLSTQAANGQPAINARDRIGTGPWYNVRGAKVAKDVADLHGDELAAARYGNNLSRTTALTEKNEPVKGAGDKPNEHDILTGSQTDGRAFTDAADHTCSNYTSSATTGSAQVGHFDRTGGGNISWNAAHGSRGCSQENLIKTGGAGLLYCFALDHTEDTQTPAIADVVAAGTRIEFIKEGFEGTEGPIALPDGGFVFTETRANRITRIAEDGSTSTFLENSNGSNGLAFNAKGELVTAQVLNPRVGVVYPLGKEKVLADQFEGVPFVRPNDLVLSKRGDIYFTDSGAPPRAADGTQPVFTPRPVVYRITPEGKLLRIANDIERPNGIQLSPDEKVLYLANTLGEYIFAYDVAADGSISGKRNFARLEGFRPNDSGVNSSGADGLAIDAKGRLYVASTSGIQVFSASGEALGIIPLPKAPQNLAFAGKDKNYLYIVGRGAAYRIATLTPGFAGRAK